MPTASALAFALMLTVTLVVACAASVPLVAVSPTQFWLLVAAQLRLVLPRLVNTYT